MPEAEMTQQPTTQPEIAQPARAATTEAAAVLSKPRGESEKLAQTSLENSGRLTLFSKGWKAYAVEQVQRGKWTEEQIAHPEQKLLPEMNSREIRQGIREGIITDPQAVSLMFQKDLSETSAFWNGWYASHAAERDDSRQLSSLMIADKEAELKPLLNNPTRQATYLAELAERDLVPQIEDAETSDPGITPKHEQAAYLYEMAARLARAAKEHEVQITQQVGQTATPEDSTAKAEAVRQELATLDKQNKSA